MGPTSLINILNGLDYRYGALGMEKIKGFWQAYEKIL